MRRADKVRRDAEREARRAARERTGLPLCAPSEADLIGRPCTEADLAAAICTAADLPPVLPEASGGDAGGGADE